MDIWLSTHYCVSSNVLIDIIFLAALTIHLDKYTHTLTILPSLTILVSNTLFYCFGKTHNIFETHTNLRIKRYTVKFYDTRYAINSLIHFSTSTGDCENLHNVPYNILYISYVSILNSIWLTFFY